LLTNPDSWVDSLAKCLKPQAFCPETEKQDSHAAGF